jgi:hypothetical protein
VVVKVPGDVCTGVEKVPHEPFDLVQLAPLQSSVGATLERPTVIVNFSVVSIGTLGFAGPNEMVAFGDANNVILLIGLLLSAFEEIVMLEL